MAKSNRFSALRQLRDQRQEDETLEQTEPELEAIESPEKQDAPAPTPAPPLSHNDDIPVAKPKSVPPPDTTVASKKRSPGRPRGRRSNPEYTQISAYIPLELLLEVQDELTEERRAKKQRTPRPVSDLVEELLANWLKKQKRKISNT